MRVDKIINNNIVSVRDQHGIEMVAMGRGIGFGKRPGDEIDDKVVEKIFRLNNMDYKVHFKELPTLFPLENIRLSADIITYAD